MSELLTAKDVELKVLKKVSFGGYAISDVEEFLNQIAEDLEAYVLRQNEQQRRLFELEEVLKRQEAMKDTIKDALILAQKSAKEKEEEARHQADLILAKAEAKVGEVDEKRRRLLQEAESTADDVVAAARTAAAQIIKSAEEMKEDAQKRLEGVDLEVEARLAEAKDKASEITATARVEARRVVNKVRNEIEECKREMTGLLLERRRFLRDTMELAKTFTHTIDDATKKLERSSLESEEKDSQKAETGRVTLSFSPVTTSLDDDEAAIS
jgi:cell division initiation protein